MPMIDEANSLSGAAVVLDSRVMVNAGLVSNTPAEAIRDSERDRNSQDID